jgi:hypothetical protein
MIGRPRSLATRSAHGDQRPAVWLHAYAGEMTCLLGTEYKHGVAGVVALQNPPFVHATSKLSLLF